MSCPGEKEEVGKRKGEGPPDTFPFASLLCVSLEGKKYEMRDRGKQWGKLVRSDLERIDELLLIYFAVEPEVPTLAIGQIGDTAFNVSFIPGDFDNEVTIDGFEKNYDKIVIEKFLGYVN